MKMVDFHSHILPGIDDGCPNTAMSLELLQMEQEQGVDTVIVTPHFYSAQYSPERFLSKRQQAWERLSARLTPDLPDIVLGAEVQYFEGIGQTEILPELCIDGTNTMLLEMPFSTWDKRTVNTVLDIQEYGKVQIVLAHIERYMKMQPANVFQEFRRFGVKMQVNADFFEGFFNRRKAIRMLRNGEIQFVGTDCHNKTSRKPDWHAVPLEAKQVSISNFKKLMADSACKM